MNRTDGFPNADIDTGLLHDPKVVALSRRLHDPVATAVHIVLYQSVVLESWSRGDRAALDETAPAWWTESVDDIAANLAAVGLLDVDGRIPEHAFEAWFRPAWERREKRRASGAIGGSRSWDKRRRSDAEGTPNPSDTPSGRPAPQAGPAGPSVTPAREGGLEAASLQETTVRELTPWPPGSER